MPWKAHTGVKTIFWTEAEIQSLRRQKRKKTGGGDGKEGEG